MRFTSLRLIFFGEFASHLCALFFSGNLLHIFAPYFFRGICFTHILTSYKNNNVEGKKWKKSPDYLHSILLNAEKGVWSWNKFEKNSRRIFAISWILTRETSDIHLHRWSQFLPMSGNFRFIIAFFLSLCK